MAGGTGAIHNLAGVFTNEGFVATHGRKPTREAMGFLPGPVSISWRDGMISEVQRLRGRTVRQSLDAEGAIATCGLVDSHTHSLYCGSRADEHFARWFGDSYEAITSGGGGIHRSVRNTEAEEDSVLLSATAASLRRMVEMGVTTVEVKTGYASSLAQELRFLRLLKKVQALEAVPSMVITSLPLHAIPIDRTEEEHFYEMLPVLNTIEKESLAQFVDAFPEQGFFSNAIVERLYRAAKAKGIPFKVHCDQLTERNSSSQFARLGATSVDHLESMTERCAHVVAGSETVATVLPTVSLFLGLDFANARYLIDAGAKLAIASDFNPGSAPVIGLQLPMILAASKMQLRPHEIFCGVTFNAAAAINRHLDCGALLPGRQADIALWRPDKADLGIGHGAIEDIIVTGRIPEVVIARGSLISRRHFS